MTLALSRGFSLFAGNSYGRVIGIIGGTLGAIAALQSIGGNYAWWSLAMFFLWVYIVHGMFIHGEEESVVPETSAPRGDDQAGREPGAPQTLQHRQAQRRPTKAWTASSEP